MHIEPLTNWANTHEWVAELWIVGSRVRGGFRPDSDLDVVLMTSLDKSTAYNLFFWGQAADEAKILSECLGVKVHLLQGDIRLQTKEVANALAGPRVQIYFKLESK